MKRPWLLSLLALAACDGRPHFSQADIDAAALGVGLRPGFLLGTATAAHQIEGNESNDWTDWEATTFPDGTPHVYQYEVSGEADDSWNRFNEDVALMRQLGANAYRFSVEWSRLEPSEGEWRDDVAEQYLQWALTLRANGIEPMVTLYHFTLPKWVAAKGGWASDDPAVLDAFEAFSGRVAQKLGGAVDLWVTVNEPNVLAYESYLAGDWPPGKRDTATSTRVFARLIEAHARAAKQIRLNDTIDANGDGRPALIGIAHHVRVFQPASDSTADTSVAAVTDAYWNDAILKAVQTGHIHLEVPGATTLDADVPDLQGSLDWLGINYYTRDYIRADLGSASLSNQYVPAGRPTNDLGWDIYPEGLYVLLKRFSRYGWPLYVTENGIADASGEVRPGFLRSHFYALQLASSEGVDVRGYFHWSLLDNFEWADGYRAKFGLFKVDFSQFDRPRAPTPAVQTFQGIAKNLGLFPVQ